MTEDFLKYFGKTIFFMAAGLGLGWLIINTPRGYEWYLFGAMMIALAGWYAHAKAKIDKEYRDSIKADEERRKEIANRPKKKYGRSGAY
jgi:hypothetical protein